MNALLRLLAVLACCGMAQAALAEQFAARIIAVLDGDTVLIRQGGGVQKIRLAGIDAPEKAQPFGEEAKRSLAGMVLNREVWVNSRAVDAYGRLVAELAVDGLDVNAEQLRRGYAWEYSHFHSDRQLVALQREAQAARRGLWAADGNVEPSAWRRQHAADYRQIPPPSGRTSPDRAPANRAAAARSPAHTQTPADPACHPLLRCAAMHSCEEARRYVQRCGRGYMDGDGDGVPCESLCNRR